MRGGSGAGVGDGATGAGVLPLSALGLRSGRLWTMRHPPGRGSGAAGGGPSIAGGGPGGGASYGGIGRLIFGIKRSEERNCREPSGCIIPSETVLGFQTT